MHYTCHGVVLVHCTMTTVLFGVWRNATRMGCQLPMQQPSLLGHHFRGQSPRTAHQVTQCRLPSMLSSRAFSRRASLSSCLSFLRKFVAASLKIWIWIPYVINFKIRWDTLQVWGYLAAAHQRRTNDIFNFFYLLTRNTLQFKTLQGDTL